jgi:hypothetical protein
MSCRTWCTQWRGLVRKNALLQARAWPATLVEILLPAAFAAVMVAVWATSGTSSSPTVQYGGSLRTVQPLAILGARLALSQQSLVVAPATSTPALVAAAAGLFRFLAQAYPAFNGSQASARRDGVGCRVDRGGGG